MNCNEIIKDIIIPIVCSIIGGLCTFGGVYLTIKHENKKSKEDKTKKSIHTKSLTLGVSGRGKKKYNLDDQLKFDV